MRRAARLDTFHGPCRGLFLAHGCEWQDFGGTFDALAVRGGWQHPRVGHPRIAIIEIKTGPKARTKSKTAERQAKFAARFPVWRITNEAEALACIKWLKG